MKKSCCYRYVQALNGHQFFYLEGRVYEVREDEMIDDHEIGMNIGEVDNEASETGCYWGNVSTFTCRGQSMLK